MCKECFNSFTSVYKFKRNFQATIEPTSLIRNVSEFLSEAQEHIEVIEHHSCLSLVPESKVELVNNFVRLVDSLQDSASKPTGTPKSQASTPVNRSSIYSPSTTRFTSKLSEYQAPSTSFHRDSIHTNNRISLLSRSNVVISDTVTRTGFSEDRKRRAEGSPQQVNTSKVPKLNTQTSPIATTSRQSVRGRQSVKSAPASPMDEESEDNNEDDRKLSAKEEKLLRQKIQSSKLGVRTYKCSQCHETCANYKEIRSHILANHFE